MHIRLNGDDYLLDDDATVADLLERLRLTGKFVAVERNRQVVPFRTFTATTLVDGDTLEIVTLVGGG